MTGGERRRLVEEEQLRPTSSAHHVAADALVVAGADKPRLGRPAFWQQRPRRGIVDDAAIAGEETALRCCDDFAKTT
jgi:hypothetical protein